jgi:GAF domain-containing protein
MTAQTSFYLLVYITAFAICFTVLYFAWKNRAAPGVYAFMISLLLEISWLTGYIFEINAATMQAKVFWDNFQYIGAFFAPIGLLFFSLGFVRIKFNARRLIVILGILPTLLLIAIFANINPDLIRINTQVVAGSPYDELTYDFGVLTNIGNYYLYIISLSYIVVLFTGLSRKNKNFKRQLWLVILGTGLPIIGLIVGQFLGFKFANQRDTSPLLFVISNAVIAFGIFRFRLFNILPVARDVLFEIIEDALIILDTEDIVLDANPSARRLLSSSFENPIGAHIKFIFPELHKRFKGMTEAHTEIEGEDGTIYDLRITLLYDRENQYIGRLVNAHNITSQKNTEKEVQLANQQNQRRAAQFQAIAELASVTTALQTLDQTLNQTVQTISRQLGYYHVGIFLVDPNNEFAVLVAANSEGGERMLARSHKLRVGQTGIVGNVAGSGKARIALNTGADAIYFNNPDLPETSSEMALPLFGTGRQVAGVLDVQSEEPNAFMQEDIQVLTTLADQVAIAINNAQLFEDTQKALKESETVYRRNLKSGWTKYARSQKLSGVQRRMLKTSFLANPVEIPGAAEVIRSGSIFQKKEDDIQSSQLTVPMKLRGELVGILNMRSDAGREWNADEIDIINAIIDRAVLSIENARLLDESRKTAQRERTIGEISTKISAGTEIEMILKTAVRELGSQISGTQVTIEIGGEGQ